MPAIWCRSSTRWCAGSESRATAVSRTAAAFGFSRPSFYEAAAALDGGGLAGLVPARPGPRRAHKLTDEVVAFAQAALDADPSLRAADLVGSIEERFGIRVHPRSDRAGPGPSERGPKVAAA